MWRERYENNGKSTLIKQTTMKKLIILLLCILAGVQAVKAKEAYAVYTDNNTTLTFYYDGLSSTRAGKTYDLNSGTTNPGWYTEGISASVTKVVFDPSFAEARPTTTYRWFNGCTNLTTITGMDYLNTSEVTNMVQMFDDCKKLTNINLSSFNTSKVTDMNSMFMNCAALKKISMSYTFYTSNVTDMSYMFSGCTVLSSLNFLTYFNTSKVTDMQFMFSNCDAVTVLDLSTFNTGNVTDMSYMFFLSNNLTTINIGSGWSTAKVTSSAYMFQNTTKIRGMQGTTYNASYVDKTYARLDEGTSKPGYLSTITYGLKVGGVEVTDMNKDNIPITSGTAKFNGSVLILTDATIDGNTSYGSIYCTRDNLTVSVNGNCTLNRSVFFRGSSYLYFTDNDDDDQLTVKGLFDFKGALQFYNRNTVINNNSTYIFMGDGTTSKLEFGPKASLIGISTGSQIVYNVIGLTFKSYTTYTFASLGADDSQVSFSATQKTILMGGQPLQGALLIGRYYPLWFGNFQISTTAPLYIKALLNQDAFTISEADDGTLFFKTYPLFAALTYNDNMFHSEAENLRVELGCNWKVTSEISDVPAMTLTGNTTITGTGTLTATSDYLGIYKSGTTGDLTIGGDVTVEAEGGIAGYYRKTHVDKWYSTLYIKDNAIVKAHKSTGAGLYDWNALVLEDSHTFTEPQGAYWNAETHQPVHADGSPIDGEWIVIGKSPRGDVNLDGVVDIADVTAVLTAMANGSHDPQYRVNDDEAVDIADVTAILTIMAGQ